MIWVFKVTDAKLQYYLIQIIVMKSSQFIGENENQNRPTSQSANKFCELFCN